MPKSLELPAEADPKATPVTGRSIAQVLQRKKPKTIKVSVVLDGDLADAVRHAEGKLRSAEVRLAGRPNDQEAQVDAREATDRLEAVRADARPETEEFVFQSLGRRGYEDMRSAHPPTKAQIDDARKAALANGNQNSQLGWNLKTFPPALIAACCTSHPMTVEQATEMWDSDVFNQAELDDLFSAAVIVNTTNRLVDLGND